MTFFQATGATARARRLLPRGIVAAALPVATLLPDLPSHHLQRRPADGFSNSGDHSGGGGSDGSRVGVAAAGMRGTENGDEGW